VKVGGLGDVISIRPQPFVDFVDPLLTLLNEANVKPRRILQFGANSCPEQSKHHAIVI